MNQENVAVVLAVVALLVSIVTAGLSYRQAHRLAGTGFRSSQELKSDLVVLAASLRSIIYKGIAASQDQEPRDISTELDRVRAFQAGPSGYALAAFAAERGSGDGPEAGQWRLLGLHLAELAGLLDEPSDESLPLRARYWATEIEETLGGITLDDVESMAQMVEDLPSLFASLRRTRTQDLVLRAWFEVAGETRRKSEPESWLDHLRELRRRGVDDPDVDLWIGVLTDDVDGVRTAIEAGADAGTTVGELLRRHGVTSEPDDSGSGSADPVDL